MIRRSWTAPTLAVAGAMVVVTGGAVAAVETDTVSTFGRGLWWAMALITTVGFIGDPPQTTAGAALSVVLMVSGFFLLALVSAALASLFVREDERTVEQAEQAELGELLALIHQLHERIDTIQGYLEQQPSWSTPWAREQAIPSAGTAPPRR